MDMQNFERQIRCIVGDVHKWRIHPLFVACKVKKDTLPERSERALFYSRWCQQSLLL